MKASIIFSSLLFRPPPSPSPLVADNRDITLSATTVTLTPGQLESSVTVTGFDDALYEGVESAQLVITSSDQAVLLSSSVIDVEIIDSDCEYWPGRKLLLICMGFHYCGTWPSSR